MIFYEIELLSVPKISFACSVVYDKYKNQFKKKENYIEISLCEQGRIWYEHDNGTTELTYPGMLIPIFCDTSCTTVAYNQEPQKHITVGILAKYRFTRYQSESDCDILSIKKRVKNNGNLLIPYQCYLGDSHDEVMSKLKKLSFLNVSGNSSDKIEAISLWFSLTASLTDFVLKQLDNTQSEHKPSELFYVERAAQYIHQNYQKALTVKEISQYLGISEGYLHRLFKTVMNMGVLEYINHHRISIAIQLIENKNTSLNEAAYSVGIHDPAYMSRLFKKVTGLSYRDYFRQKRLHPY